MSDIKIISDNQIKYETNLVLAYYSKYYYSQFNECEANYIEGKGHTSLILLFLLFENIVKSVLNDFNSSFQKLNIKLKQEFLINDEELQFLNDEYISVRKIRNILAHANLSKYDLIIDNLTHTYPFTENETCLILYDKISIIISGIILKIIIPSTTLQYEVNINHLITDLKINLITRTPEDLMGFKGIPLNSEWQKLDEAVKYRLVENSPDNNILKMIFKNLKNIEGN